MNQILKLLKTLNENSNANNSNNSFDDCLLEEEMELFAAEASARRTLIHNVNEPQIEIQDVPPSGSTRH